MIMGILLGEDVCPNALRGKRKLKPELDRMKPSEGGDQTFRGRPSQPNLWATPGGVRVLNR